MSINSKRRSKMDTETINTKAEQITLLFEEIKALNEELKPLFKMIESEKWQTLSRDIRRAQSIFLLLVEKLEKAIILTPESKETLPLLLRLKRAIRKSFKGLSIVNGYMKVKELYDK